MESGGAGPSWRARLIRRYRPLTLVASALLASALVLACGAEGPFDGAMFDAGVLLRGAVLPRSSRPSATTAIVAVDWASLRSPRMASLPRALFAPVWGTLVEGLSAAGVRLTVLDFVLEFSGNAFIPNYDRPFLEALARNRERVILVRNGETEPATAFKAAVGALGGRLNVALSELIPDQDGVIRTVPWGFRDDKDRMHLSVMGEALRRMGQEAGEAPIRYLPSGTLETEIPTYGLGDVLSCLDSAEGRMRLHDALGGKVVLVGSTLPDEDRKTAPDRWLLRLAHETPPLASDLPCSLDRLGVSAPATGTAPGVFIHAAGMASVLEDRALTTVSPGMVALFAGAAAAVAACATLYLSPFLALFVLVIDLSLCLLLSWSLPLAGLWLPVADAALAAIGATGLGQVARYLAEVRQRRHLQRVFGQYLAPQIVAQFLASGEQPKVGGEIRDISCMFADLSGFTALSGRLPPDALLLITNRYLASIVRAIEETGGYVDKFIGDSVMAIWNAPAQKPEHASCAVEAAWAAAEAIRCEGEAAHATGAPAFSVKIGINSGPAIVGNVGAEGRFNYTAIGAAVNIAARLEPLPGIYGCPIVLSETTARLTESRWILCELDKVRVKGREEPLVIYTPLGRRGEGDGPARRYAERWEQALSAYRVGRFTEATTLWRMLASSDGLFSSIPASLMAERAERLAADPPGAWNGVWTTGKA